VGKNPKTHQIICFCNNVAKDVIQRAIKEGCHTLNEIYDKTTAGVGPCGGSCRRKIAPLLEHFLVNGDFPAEPNSPDPDQKKLTEF
jgi:bacterioferritin-associated ferredoxin